MKGKSSILSALIILTLGVVMIIVNRSLTSQGVVIAGGIVFLVASVLNIWSLMRSPKEGARRSWGASAIGWITGVAGVILGVSMLIFESAFVALVTFLFGALLVIGALFHFYVLAISYRPVALPPWLYAVPLLLLGAGVYALYNFGVQNDSLTNIITGSGLVVFAIGVFLESYFIGVHNKAVNKPSRVQHNEPQVEDVSHTEIRTLDDPQK